MTNTNATGRECAHCDTPFTTVYETKLYCDRNCADKARAKRNRRRSPRQGPHCPACVKCHASIESPTFDGRYCSTTCRLQASEDRKRARKEPLSRSCKRCRTPFNPTHPRQTYCSNECAHPPLHGPMVNNCMRCGTPIDRRSLRTRFCSKHCARHGVRRTHKHRDKILRRMRELSGATLTTAQWEQIKDAYKHQCAYCEAPSQAMDHVMPLSLGGTHTADNVVPACHSCNSSKGAKHPTQWNKELATRRKPKPQATQTHLFHTAAFTAHHVNATELTLF